MKSNSLIHCSLAAGLLMSAFWTAGSAAAAPMETAASAEVPALSLSALTEAVPDAQAPAARIAAAPRAMPLGAVNTNLFQLTLWNFIDGIRAQQRSDYFQAAHTLSATLKNTIADSLPVSPVPLPPSAWLFPAGLASLLGLRRWKASRRRV